MKRQKYIDITLFLLRIAVAVIFIQVGGFKLFSWFGGMASVGAAMSPLMWVAGILEVFGGIAILFGIFTRPIAFILAGEMAFAYFMGHFAWAAMWPIQNHGEAAVLLCFIFLFMSAYGAGKYSIDGLRAKGKETVATTAV